MNATYAKYLRSVVVANSERTSVNAKRMGDLTEAIEQLESHATDIAVEIAKLHDRIDVLQGENTRLQANNILVSGLIAQLDSSGK